MDRSQAIAVMFIGACVLVSHALADEPVATGIPPKSGIVNLEFSRVYAHTKKVGLGHEHAVEGRLKEGTLNLSDSSGDMGKLVFDMSSFTADGSTARKYVGLQGNTDEQTREAVDANMLGKDVLSVKKYATAEFKLKSASKLKTASNGKQTLELVGDFSLHGVKKEVVIPCVLDQVNGWNHLHGEFRILQTDFGIKPFSKALGAVGVGNEVVIYGELLLLPNKRCQ